LEDIRIHKFENRLHTVPNDQRSFKQTHFGYSAELCLEGWPSEDGRKAGSPEARRSSPY
jgi:hypothetical protein